MELDGFDIRIEVAYRDRKWAIRHFLDKQAPLRLDLRQLATELADRVLAEAPLPEVSYPDQPSRVSYQLLAEVARLRTEVDRLRNQLGEPS